MTTLGVARAIGAGLGLLGLAAATPGSAAGDEAEFYRGKTVRIIVNAAGGGFDVSARALARHLGRHIPGEPAVAVENVSGAGGLVAANHLYRTVKPDGLTIGHFSGDLLLQQVLGRPGVEFDARRFQYVGAGSAEHIACAFSRASGITSLDRWVSATTPLRLGGTAPGSNGDNATRILKTVLELPIRVVSGYRGTAAIRLAVEAGELDGACFNWASMRTAWQHALDSGEVIVVLQLAPRPLADLPAVPLVTDLPATDDARRLVAATILRASGLARPYALPPGTPPERVAVIRRAFQAALRDPGFLADAGRAKLDVTPVSGEEVERYVAGLFTLDPATAVRLRKILFD
jgi:tripartite-type tricarboxylate transporter receptor subunit TctC